MTRPRKFRSEYPRDFLEKLEKREKRATAASRHPRQSQAKPQPQLFIDWCRQFILEQEPLWYTPGQPWRVPAGHRPSGILHCNDNESCLFCCREPGTVLELTLDRSVAETALQLARSKPQAPGLAQHGQVILAEPAKLANVAPGPDGKPRPARTTAYFIWRERPEHFESPDLSPAEQLALAVLEQELTAQRKALQSRRSKPPPDMLMSELAPFSPLAGRLAHVYAAVAYHRAAGLLLPDVRQDQLGIVLRRQVPIIALVRPGGGLKCPPTPQRLPLPEPPPWPLSLYESLPPLSVVPY